MQKNTPTSKQSFKKAERLVSKNLIEQIAKGKVLYLSPLKIIYCKIALKNSSYPAQIAFSVPKRIIKKAADRNLLKRRMKEVYRKNKSVLYEALHKKNIQVGIIIVFTQKSLAEYKLLEEKIILSLQKIAAVE